MEDIPVHRSVAADGKTGGRRPHLRHSRFLVTISTNRVYNPDAEGAAEQYAAFDSVITKITELPLDQLFKILEPDDTWNPRTIRDVTLEAGIEVGPKTKRLHAHAFLSVSHHTRINLRFEELKQLIKDELGFPVYINYKLYKDAGTKSLEGILSHYVNKDHSG